MIRSLEVSSRPQTVLIHRSASSFVKRLFDIIGSLLGLFLLVIVFLPVAIAIRLNSSGPIFERQIRCGLMGRLFTLRKFRSTSTKSGNFRYFVKGKMDEFCPEDLANSRVTRVGKFLKLTGIEILPQFWNVLKGEMSLVGVHPPTPKDIQNYPVHYWKRLAVKPGLTGQWRISQNLEPNNLEAIVDLDLQYQEIWTPWYDLLVIAKTFKTLPMKMLRNH